MWDIINNKFLIINALKNKAASGDREYRLRGAISHLIRKLTEMTEKQTWLCKEQIFQTGK